MKKITAFTLMLVCFIMNAYSQNALSYSDVVQVEGVTKDELYNRAKLWLASTYNSSNDVIQLDNKDEGQVIGKARMRYTPTIYSGSGAITGGVKYTINIYVKEGRYKYELTDFIHDPTGNQYGAASMGLITTDEEYPNPRPMAKKWSDKVWVDIKKQIETHSLPLITSLKEGMNKPAETQSDDW